MAFSFSAETKEALSTLPVKAVHCRRAELAAITAAVGLVDIREDGELLFVLQTENLPTLRRADYLVRVLCGLEPRVFVLSGAGFRTPVYNLVLQDQRVIAKLLKDLGYMTGRGVLRELTAASPAALLKAECCRRAFLRGAFLAAGFVADPNTAYHLELVCGSEERAEQLMLLLKEFGLPAKTTLRKNTPLVYMKEADGISDFLSLTGAVKSRLEWENVRILRSLQGSVNRQVNCETANLNKTVSTGVKQSEAIKLIEEKMGIKNLPAGLQEIAALRLEHPEATLPELGGYFDPPLGKSGVNHRLRKIMEIAEDLKANAKDS